MTHIFDEDIQFEAKNFWRDQEFYNICCDEDDNEICSFDIIAADDEQNVIIHNSCAGREGQPFNYYITLYRKNNGGHNFCMHPFNPIEYPETQEYLEGDLVRNPDLTPLTQTEIKFWSEVAILYRDIPFWMIEFELDREDLCIIDEDDEDENEENGSCFDYYGLEQLDSVRAAMNLAAAQLEQEKGDLESAKMVSGIYLGDADASTVADCMADLDDYLDSYLSPFDGEKK